MSDISYATAEGPVKAYLAEPQGAGPWLGVVVVMDVFGLSGDIARSATGRPARDTWAWPRTSIPGAPR